MPQDKFTALWVSHSSIGDYLKCPRSYYLNNVYKDPKTGHKIQLMSPPLALGQVVHEVLESLSTLPVEKRFATPLTERFDQLWPKVSGKQGGFFDEDTEHYYQERGKKMLRQVQNNPGPLERLAVKIQQELPYYWLSEKENIILCGKIDWLEYLPEEDAVHIIDFKSGKKREDDDSLQLPIYHLLVTNVQKRDVQKASYWYIESDEKPTQKQLSDIEEAHTQVLRIAKKMKTARKLEHFKCPQGEAGCRFCKPLEKVVRGEAIKVGTSEFNQDIYVLPSQDSVEESEAVIL
jgi:ATP-dependent helicase/DNAse subunit B